MPAFKIEINDRAVLDALNGLAARAGNPAPALRAIGESLLVQTRRTFETGSDPWGRPWAANKPSTLARYVGTFGKSSFKKSGDLSQRGAARLAGKRPLTGESRQLSTQISYHVADGVLTVGSSMVYAAMQQFGGTQAQFPHLWGDIPARPFLPVTASGELAPEAKRTVADVIQEFLTGSAD